MIRIRVSSLLAAILAAAACGDSFDAAGETPSPSSDAGLDQRPTDSASHFDGTGADAVAGSAGAGGSAGSGGTAGLGGSAGTGGVSGTGGSAGLGGLAGTGASAGAGGSSGTGGQAGTGGTAGTGGVAGSGGVSGTGGSGGGPELDSGTDGEPPPSDAATDGADASAYLVCDGKGAGTAACVSPKPCYTGTCADNGFTCGSFVNCAGEPQVCGDGGTSVHLLDDEWNSVMGGAMDAVRACVIAWLPGQAGTYSNPKLGHMWGCGVFSIWVDAGAGVPPAYCAWAEGYAPPPHPNCLGAITGSGSQTGSSCMPETLVWCCADAT